MHIHIYKINSSNKNKIKIKKVKVILQIYYRNLQVYTNLEKVVYSAHNKERYFKHNDYATFIPIRIYNNFLMPSNNYTIFGCSDSLRDDFYSYFRLCFFFLIRFQPRLAYHVWFACPFKSLLFYKSFTIPLLISPLQLIFWRN